MLLEKSTTGHRAFSRLFDEIISSATFPLQLGEERLTLSEAEILSKLYVPEREVRQAAAAGSHRRACGREAACLPSLPIPSFMIKSWMIVSPITPPLKRRGTLPTKWRAGTVHTMLEACVDGFATVARYYRLKREMLGLETLYHYDRYAPLREMAADIPWETATKDRAARLYRLFSGAGRVGAPVLRGTLDRCRSTPREEQRRILRGRCSGLASVCTDELPGHATRCDDAGA